MPTIVVVVLSQRINDNNCTVNVYEPDQYVAGRVLVDGLALVVVVVDYDEPCNMMGLLVRARASSSSSDIVLALDRKYIREYMIS